MIYAFYGRTAFRQKGSEPSDLAFVFPVVFLIDPSSAPKPKYVFGFDSGAFMDGYMDAYLDPYMPLFDFALDPDVRTAASLIEYFFGDSAAFLKNLPRKGVIVPEGNFEAVSYQKLLAAGGREVHKLDDRTSTPEVIFDDPIDLAKSVKAVILPDVLADDPQIGGGIDSLGILKDGYEWIGVSRPAEYHMLIRMRVKSIFRSLGWL